jgi:hypothetical protein
MLLRCPIRSPQRQMRHKAICPRQRNFRRSVILANATAATFSKTSVKKKFHRRFVKKARIQGVLIICGKFNLFEPACVPQAHVVGGRVFEF